MPPSLNRELVSKPNSDTINETIRGGLINGRLCDGSAPAPACQRISSPAGIRPSAWPSAAAPHRVGSSPLVKRTEPRHAGCPGWAGGCRTERTDRIDPRTTALIVVDMENDFVAPGASLETPAGRAMLPQLGRVLACRRTCGIPHPHDPRPRRMAQSWPLRTVARRAMPAAFPLMAPAAVRCSSQNLATVVFSAPMAVIRPMACASEAGGWRRTGW